MIIHMAPRYLPRAYSIGRDHGVGVAQTGYVTRPGDGRGLLVVSAEVTVGGDEEAVVDYLAALPVAWEPDADHVETVLLLETAVTAARVLGWRDKYGSPHLSVGSWMVSPPQQR